MVFSIIYQTRLLFGIVLSGEWLSNRNVFKKVQIKWCKYTSIAYNISKFWCQQTYKDQTLSSDMVTCGNKIVREYIFSTKQRSHNDEDEKDCQPACTRWSFDLRQITVTWSCDYLTVITYQWLVIKFLSIVIEIKTAIDISVESGSWLTKK